jgi:hypothetical protein
MTELKIALNFRGLIRTFPYILIHLDVFMEFFVIIYVINLLNF